MAKKTKVKTTVGPRWAKFCGWLLRKMGWESVGGPMKEEKAIVLGVPHTTVWDFLVSYLFYTQFGKVAHIMVKKSFFVWPLGPILKACGAVPTDLSSPATTVKSLIEVMEDVPEFHLALAPEGSRSLVKRWKSGYHLIARETGTTTVPWVSRAITRTSSPSLIRNPKTPKPYGQENQEPVQGMA